MKLKDYFRNLPIKHKLLLITLTICAVVLLITVSALFLFQVLDFRANFKRDTATLSAITAKNCTGALVFGDSKAANEIILSLKGKSSVQGVYLVNANNKVMALFGDLKAAAVRTQFPLPNEFKFYDGSMLYDEDIYLDRKRIGTLYLRMDYQGVFSELIHFYSFTIVTVVVLSALLAFWLSEKLGRLITWPLFNLTETARRVAEKNDYSARTNVGNRKDELGLLGSSFNHMLERIQSQDAALHVSQQKLGTLVNSIDGIVWEWDAVTFQFTFVSEQCRAILGYPPEAWLGNPNFWDEVVHPDDLERATAHCMAAIARREPYNYEYRMIAGDQRVVWIRESGVVLVNPNQSVMFRGILQDITQHKLAEDELARTSMMLRELMSNTNDFIYFKDLESRFVECSDSFLSLFKVASLKDVIGRKDSDFFESGHALPAYADEQDIIRTRKPLVGKLETETFADGRKNWVLTSKYPWIDGAGKVIGTFGMSKDITPLKEAEHLLKETHSRLMETSRRAGMAEVATGVLHNVGNVLNSVNVSTTLLNSEMEKSKITYLRQATGLMREHLPELNQFLATDARGKQLPEFLFKVSDAMDAEQLRWREELRGLKKNLEHMKEIVAMQQNYARVSGIFEALNPGDLVEDALQINLAGLQRHGVEVVRDFHPTPRIMVDKHKVMQILINLISNAKYALDNNPSSEKTLTLRIISAAPEHVQIIVQDNGVGIPPENLTRIFAHGFTTKEDGHGFGLHSGALAAKELGGALTADSAGLGTGARFTLELPVANNKN